MRLGPVPPVGTARATPWWAGKHNKSCRKGILAAFSEETMREGRRGRGKKGKQFLHLLPCHFPKKKKKRHVCLFLQKKYEELLCCPWRSGNRFRVKSHLLRAYVDLGAEAERAKEEENKADPREAACDRAGGQ